MSAFDPLAIGHALKDAKKKAAQTSGLVGGRNGPVVTTDRSEHRKATEALGRIDLAQALAVALAVPNQSKLHQLMFGGETSA